MAKVERPSWAWFALLDGGLVLLARLALSEPAHARASEATGGALPPRPALQQLLAAAAAIHVGEAVLAGRMARKRGLRPGGWRRQTLVVGFPSLLVLRRIPPA